MGATERSSQGSGTSFSALLCRDSLRQYKYVHPSGFIVSLTERASHSAGTILLLVSLPTFNEHFLLSHVDLHPHQGPPFSQPGVVVLQRPGGFGQLPGVFPQQSPQQPGLFATQQPGVFSPQTGIFTQHSGSLGLQSPAFLRQGPGVTLQPGIFSDESGIFSVVNGPSSTPTAATDAVPPIPVPGSSPYRGVRAVSEARSV